MVRAGVVGFLLTACGAALSNNAGIAPKLASAPMPHVRLTAANLGLVINEADSYSLQVGAYYKLARAIPERNVVRVRLPVRSAISAAELKASAEMLRRNMPQAVQALALAWTIPYRVDCMSITSAFAFGFDTAHCSSGCERTPYSPYFNSETTQPYSELGVRPAMALAATSVQQAKRLIDRGVRSDRSSPIGTAYLLDTSDTVRSARASSFSSARLLASPRLDVVIENSDALHNRNDVMFYFTGLRRVDSIRSNIYLPGAIADHLTSHGGILLDSPQMSALSWIEAGATGSYGTVVEPCAFTGKFPSVPIVLRRYLSGESLIEAYWKSVAMPSQGVFVGEPLAAPFASPHGGPSSQ